MVNKEILDQELREAYLEQSYETTHQALLAVIALHEPWEIYRGGTQGYGKACKKCGADCFYPCPTIQAIMNEFE